MKNVFYSILIFFLSLFSEKTIAQSAPDMVANPDIHGIVFSLSGNQLAYPIINLGAQNAVQLDFDDFSGSVKNYYYTFVLCDADWQPVDDPSPNYLNGFSQDRIPTYTISSYAKVNYIHYSISLPQQNCMPTRSGNYLLKVFENGDPSQLAFSRRLLIENPRVAISAEVQQPYDNEKTGTYQKVQFSINVAPLQLQSPQQQLKVVVLQNFRWDNAVSGIQPAFMRGQVYEYNGERDLLFQAGKEYRRADLQSFRYQSEFVKSIDVTQVPFVVEMKTDKSRMNEDYLPISDYDGFFNITTLEQIDPNTQGDYAWVHFTYVSDDGKPYADRDVYIVGQMNNYVYDDNSKLKFNPDKGYYETTLLLKQGYYNYMYVTKSADNPAPDFSLAEGNNWLTENNYTVLVYYQSFSDRAPQLVGVKTISSQKQQ